MELKLGKDTKMLQQQKSFNRTFMELKPSFQLILNQFNWF